MSKYEEYRSSRISWGINVLGSFCIEIEASDGTTGFATGFGSPPACWIVSQHLERFLIGADPRNTNRLWDQMFRLTMFYGRKGLPIAVGGREKTGSFQFVVTDALSMHVVGSHLPSDFGVRTGPEHVYFSAYSLFDVQSTIVRMLAHLSIERSEWVLRVNFACF